MVLSRGTQPGRGGDGGKEEVFRQHLRPPVGPLAMGTGTPRLRLSEITDRVNLYPGDFVPSVEATLRELRNDGAAMLQEQRGRILQAYKSR